MQARPTNAKHLGAVLLAVALAFLVHWIGFGSWEGFHRGVDFNQGPLEDFTGPYYRQALAMGADQQLEPWFLYPPSFAVMLAPLAHLDPVVASWTWLAILLGASAALVLAALSMLGARSRPWLTFAFVLCFACSLPWVHDLHWGQVSTLVWALTLLGLRAWTRGQSWRAALFLGLGIATKLFPAWFLLALVMRGDWRGIARVGLVTALLMLLLPFLVMGPSSTFAFYVDMQAGLQHAAKTLFWVSEGSQFGPAVLHRFWGQPNGLFAVLAWGLPLCLAAALLAGCARLLRWAPKVEADAGAEAAGEASPDRELIALVLLASALPLVLSPSWAHYFVWLPWGIFVFWQRLPGAIPRGLLVVAAIGISTPVFLLMGGHPEYVRAGVLTLATLCLPLAYWIQSTLIASPETGSEELT